MSWYNKTGSIIVLNNIKYKLKYSNLFKLSYLKIYLLCRKYIYVPNRCTSGSLTAALAFFCCFTSSNLNLASNLKLEKTKRPTTQNNRLSIRNITKNHHTRSQQTKEHANVTVFTHHKKWTKHSFNNLKT